MNARAVEIVAAASLADADRAEKAADAAGLRRANLLTSMAAAAASEALEQAEERGFVPEGERTALFVALDTGPINDNFAFLDSIRSNGEGFGSPISFSHSVNSSVAGYLSMIFGLTGNVVTTASFFWPFVEALQSARLALLGGYVQAALVVFAHEEVVMFKQAAELTSGKGAGSEFAGTRASAWLLAATGDAEGSRRAKGSALLGEVFAKWQGTTGTELLLGRCKLTGTDGEMYEASRALHAEALTLWLRAGMQGRDGKRVWKALAPFGQAEVEVQGPSSRG